MKKLHKTGTSILLALAPAAALGVTAAVIATSIKVDEGDEPKVVEEDQWFEELKKVKEAYNQYKYTFDRTDLVLKVKGQETPFNDVSFSEYMFYQEESPKDKYKAKIDGQSQEGGFEYPITAPTYSELKDMVKEAKLSSYSITYKYSKNALTIEIIATEDDYYKCTFNRNGYIISSDYKGDVMSIGEATYTIDYKVSTPHEVTTYYLFGPTDTGNYQSRGHMMDSKKTYTYKFTATLEHPIQYIYVNLDAQTGLQLISDKITVKVNGLTVASEYDTSNYFIKLDNEYSGEIEVMFQIAENQGESTFTTAGGYVYAAKQQ